MRPYLKWAGAGLAVLTGAVVLAIVLFDWNWLRGPLEARLSAATGKDVHIDGPITGEFAWTPRITLSDIKIDEPNWRPNSNVASIGRVEATIEIKKLLLGQISIPSLAIVKPVAHLERRGNEANWDIAQEAMGPSNRHAVPLFGDVTISNGQISYHDPAKHLSVDAALSLLKGNGGPGGEPFTLSGKGTYQHAPFTLRLTGDSLVHMRKDSKPYNVDIKTDLADTHLAINGTIEDPVKMSGLALGVQISGQNAAGLYRYLGIPAPTTPPYHLSGTLDRTGKDQWTFRNFGGAVGGSDLDGTLNFDLSRPRLAMSGSLESKKLNLADFGVAFGVPTKPAANEPVAAHQKRVVANYAASDKLLPNVPLEVDAVRNVDIDVTFKGAKVLAEDLPLEHIAMHIRTKDGVMSLDPVQLGIAGGTLSGTSVIDARGEAVKSESDIRFTDFRLERFLKPAGGGEAAATGAIDGRIRFSGTGDTLRGALGTANGNASVIVSDGSMNKLVSSMLGLDVAKTLGVLISGDKTKKVELRCMVADFAIQEGTMTPRVFVMDTSDTTVTGKGSVSLTNETLDMSLKGAPRKASLSLRGPILIKGTFRNPHFGVGAEAIARAGGAVVLGALLTPIASVITFVDAGKHSADCAGLAAAATQDTAGPPPVNPTAASSRRTARASQQGQSRMEQSGGR